MKKTEKQLEYERLIKEDPLNFRHVKHPSQKVCELAFNLNHDTFVYIKDKNKTKKMCKAAVVYNSSFVIYVPHQYWEESYTTLIKNNIDWYAKISIKNKEKVINEMGDELLLVFAKRYTVINLCNYEQIVCLIKNNMARVILSYKDGYAILEVVQKSAVTLLEQTSIQDAIEKALELTKKITVDVSIINLLSSNEKKLLGVKNLNSQLDNIIKSISENKSEKNELYYPIIPQSQIQIATNNNQLDNQNLQFNYISDMHLQHQIQERHINTPEGIRDFLISTIKSLLQSRTAYYQIFVGDITTDFKLYKLFFDLYLNMTQRTTIIILGNHELFDFNSYDEAVTEYRKFFNNCQNTIFLHNQFLLIYPNKYKVYNTITEIEEWNDPKCILLGGLGFAHADRYSAKHLNFGPELISADSKAAEAKKFEKFYQSLVNVDAKCKKIVVSHTPPQEWCNIELNNQIIYVHGHTHHNIAYQLPNGTQIYANGQVGYKKNNIYFAELGIDTSFDIFADYGDGLYEIRCQQYRSFLEHQNINVHLNRSDIQIYMLKRCDYYMFFASRELKNGIAWYVMHGGMLLRAGLQSKDDIQYYNDTIPQYVHNLNMFMQKYRAAQKTISDAIMALDGNGRIHGCIIDIENPKFMPWSLCHIYLNPVDGKTTFYYADNISSRQIYPSFAAMLNAKPLAELLDTIIAKSHMLEGTKPLALINQLNTGIEIYEEKDVEPILEYGTEMYKLSRLIYKIQRVCDKHIISIWSDVLANGTPLLPISKTLDNKG